MFFEKRGLIFGLIILLLSFIFISAATIDDETTDSGASEEETGTIPTATTDTCPSGYTCDAGSDATADQDAVPASLTVSENAPITKFDNIPADTEMLSNFRSEEHTS